MSIGLYQICALSLLIFIIYMGRIVKSFQGPQWGLLISRVGKCPNWETVMAPVCRWICSPDLIWIRLSTSTLWFTSRNIRCQMQKGMYANHSCHESWVMTEKICDWKCQLQWWSDNQRFVGATMLILFKWIRNMDIRESLYIELL